jgi:hypothetical protein
MKGVYSVPTICEQLMELEEMGRTCAEWTQLLADEMAWQDEMEANANEGRADKSSESEGGKSPTAEGGGSPKAAGSGALTTVLNQLKEFDVIRHRIYVSTDRGEAKKLAKRRDQMCISLEAPVVEVLDAQEQTYAGLQTRMKRIRSSEQRLGAILDSLRDGQGGGGTATAADQAGQGAGDGVGATEPENPEGTAMATALSERRAAVAAKLGQAESAAPTVAPANPGALRDRLRSQLEKSMQDFGGAFNLSSESPTCLGVHIVEKMMTLRTMSADDASVVSAVLLRGRGISSEESSEMEAQMQARDAERSALQISLVEDIRTAEALCIVLAQAVHTYLDFERMRLCCDHEADLAIQERMEAALMGDAAANGGGGAGQLVDCKAALELVQEGRVGNAHGLSLVIGLLRARLEELRQLPLLRSEATKLWRSVRRADKTVVRLVVMQKAWHNRYEEALEYGEISSESDDEELFGDEDFSVIDAETVQERMG